MSVLDEFIEQLMKLRDGNQTADEQETEAPVAETSSTTAEPSNEEPATEEEADARDERIAELEAKVEGLTAMASYYVCLLYTSPSPRD